MEYVNIGNSGLKVSKVGLGCMSFGNPAAWIHKWVLGEQESIDIIKYGLDNGINFFDTANVYSAGVSETILGKAIKQYAKRSDVVIATKVGFGVGDDDSLIGLSRCAIVTQIERSLERLQMDYVDLYIIHRWDYSTPIEETMEALHDLVKSGKVRYIGASSMYAWQFAKAQEVARANGWTEFISMQNHMNLLYREEEREMLPLCYDQGVGLTPYSPLAAGRVARPLGTQTMRAETDQVAKSKYSQNLEIDEIIIDRVEELAAKHQVAMSVIAIAWLYSKPGVAAPIIGASKTKYIDEAIAGSKFQLSYEEITYLEEVYRPKELVGPLASGPIKL